MMGSWRLKVPVSPEPGLGRQATQPRGPPGRWFKLASPLEFDSGQRSGHGVGEKLPTRPGRSHAVLRAPSSALSGAERGELVEEVACERGLKVAVGFQPARAEGKVSGRRQQDEQGLGGPVRRVRRVRLRG